MSAVATIAVVTGTRAEFGLLRSTMRAIDANPSLRLRVVVAGSHLIGPAATWREVAAEFTIDARVEMQRDGEPRDRLHDAFSLGRGVAGFADAFSSMRPDCVVVLGDRIEAFAAASATSVMGIPVAHLHGGDRAEGVADEAMRHAITKLAHLHFPATRLSAERIERMGEDASRVRVVGSPAIDGLSSIAPLADDGFAALGAPQVILSMHPIGRTDDEEARDARAVLDGLSGLRVLAMAPNLDAGRHGVAHALADAAASGRIRVLEHLPRDRFVALCRAVAQRGGVIVGNSSAGLIECAALDPCLPCVNVGPRQAGRERPASVVDVDASASAVSAGVAHARSLGGRRIDHPYGDGRTGERIAQALSDAGLHVPTLRARLVRKHNAY